MTSYRKSQMKAVLWSFLATVVVCTPAWADDTEIYFGGTTTSVTVKPNVLFVLDTSGSMTSTDGGSTTRLARMKEALTNILNSAQDINVGLMRFTNPGGPVLYPVSYIDEEITSDSQQTAITGVLASAISSGDDDVEEDNSGVVTMDSTTLDMATITTSASTTDVSVRVSSGNDDAEEKVSNGDMNRTSTDLELMHESSEQIVGIRFDSVDIPVGSTIVSAKITFEIDEEHSESSDDVSIRISAQDSDDPVSFGSSDNNISGSGRPKTTANTSWTITTSPAVNNDLITPDLTSLVQEVVDRSGWAPNNAMVFILEHISGDGVRWVESYNGESGSAPLLEITYESGTSGTTNQTTGLRFSDLAIPQGATITSASISFTAEGATSDPTSLVIHAEAADQSSGFSATPNDVTGRTTTTASVGWNTMGPWTGNASYQSPDLTNIVQEIVDRSGWCGGNSMNFIISGSGLRSAKSYENSPSEAPTLSITFDPDSNPTGCVNQEYSVRVSQSSDDAEQIGSSVNLTSSDLELVTDGSSNQTIGIRFNNLQLNQGTVLSTAYLELAVDETGSTESTSLTIKAEDTDNSVTFNTSTTISSRSTTSASISWDITEQWSTEHELKRSPNIASLINEIVGRSGWEAGNSLTLIITGSGKRVVESYDGSSLAPRIVYYASPSAVPENTNTVRSELITIVNDLDHKSGTPIVDTLYEAALYYRGDAVDYGKTRGSGSGTRAETRVSHPGSYTGGTLVQPTGCTSENLGSSSCVDEEITGNPVYKSPITESCQSNHIVLLTDGYASVNTSASKVRTLTGDASCIDSGSAACGPEIVRFLRNVDQLSMNDDQKIVTHTIGFNFSDQWLRDLAETYGGGGFYEANSATELTTAFDTIIKSILATNSTFAKAAVTASQYSRFYHRDDIYFALFKPQETAKWLGNLKRYKLTPDAEIYDNSLTPKPAVDPDSGFFADNSQSFWVDDDSADGDSGIDEDDARPDGGDITKGGAAHRLPSTRKLFTNIAGSNLNVTNNLLHEDNTGNLTKAVLGIDAQSDEYRTDLLQWARGLDSADEKRNQMGDVLHSQPIILTYDSTPTTPDSTIYFGSNEGYLHAVNADTGVEQFAFIPQELLPNLNTYFSNQAVDPRPYGIDGSIVAWTNDDAGDGDLSDTNDFAYIYFGMRRGGRNYYALDVTDRNNPTVLWQINGGSGDFAELGQTWSTPVKTKVKLNGVSTDVLIFGGGYDDNQDDVTVRTPDNMGNAIFMVNAETGALVWSAGNNSSHDLVLSSMDYSIPSDLRMIDVDFDDHVDQLYVGDMGGQIWRFDINSGATSASNLVNGAAIANLAESGTTANNRRFYNALSLSYVLEGTHRYLALSVGSGFRAHPLNTSIEDRFYMIKLTDAFTAPTTYPSYTEDDLYDATDNLITEGTDEEQTAAETALSNSATDRKQGWYIRLGTSGEKVLAKALTVNNQIVFTTYEPTPSSLGTCQATQGTNRIYVTSLFDATPKIDQDEDTAMTGSDRSKEIVTVGFGGAPTVMAGEQNSNLYTGAVSHSDIDLGPDSIRTYWMEENE
ncbi:PilC/PilY family type IV pilus protein [Motiliproteus sp. MSK22-1]|uniref:PilC/PilY family type IV pilus protein n=1 Tax=Motiliproteus sp. MSK22-1 TaxID=1897630 RepID=UPI000977DE85|nr:PilC/PilY family type IV pilus protein [Motiliproteus sp. MSK22-1]OMH33723.1 hypothetical protein BGP75_12025 [Motiliproteus sp. MSK22-1]